MPKTTVARKLKVIPVKDAKMGTVGYLRNTNFPRYDGKLVIRSYSGLVALEPMEYGNEKVLGVSWDSLPEFDIEVLEEGTVVTITI